MLEFIAGFLSALQKALPILLAIFVVVFIGIMITRIIFAILLHQASKRLKKLKEIKNKYYKKKANYIKEDEELLRKLDEIPRAHSAVKAELQAKSANQESGSYEIIASEEQERDKMELNEINIVDIVQPIGFWTSMILGQKLTYLINSAQIINKRGNKGFWASMIEAKEREAGKQHARGR